MSSTPGNQSHTSQERQKQIFSDISLIIKLISCYKNGKQNEKPNNAQGVSSLSLINPSSFSNGHSSFSAYDFANFYSSYK
jgi:hypothetical protein